jgi:transcriptional regulator PpsR
MDADTATTSPATARFSRGVLGSLDAAVAHRVVAAGGDVALIIDREGVICDLAVSDEAIARDAADSWLDRRWSDTVTIDSKKKVDELLRDALRSGSTRWREVNQVTSDQKSMMIRFMAVEAGREGQVIAIGRDDRATAAIQQRLVEAQQALERDYSRVRDAEFRYRLLFRLSGEAVLVVDAATKKIVEVNPAAETLIDCRTPLVGESFLRIFSPDGQEAAAALLAAVQSNSKTSASDMRLSGPHQDFQVSASLFRQDRVSQFLVRLSPADRQPLTESRGADLRAVMERIPDAFVITDDAFKILTANEAFLDLARIGAQEQAVGQSLNTLLGRPGLDRNILLDNLRAHGSVKNFSTLLRTLHDDEETVEVSAVAVPGPETNFGFTFRTVSRRLNDRSQSSPALRRSVEQLTELVGRVTLKELVRETTELVERLCIEAALELSKDNRASAAEILGLSRQGLYAKMHRFKLGNLPENPDPRDRP